MILKLGDLLVEAKLLTSEQLKTALDYQRKTGQKLGEVLEKLGFVSEDEILACLASQQGMEIVNLKNIIIPNALVKKIPLQLIEKYNIIPVGIKGDTLTIATSDPTDYEVVEQIQLLTDLKVEMVLATTTEIKASIRDVFQPAHKKSKEKDDILDELSGTTKNKKKPANSNEILNHPLTRLLIDKNIITEDELLKKIEEK
jgi:type IV pilus assembly protein PilB